MKQKILVKGFSIWKWGFNFNEGGIFSTWVPFTIAVNLYNLRLYFSIHYPWIYYGKNWNIDPQYGKNSWRLCWRNLFTIVIRK